MISACPATSAHGRSLKFPEPDEIFKSDYGEFLYFSFTIAVASQSADVSITDRPMCRRVPAAIGAVLRVQHRHLAFTINFAVGLF